MYLDQMTPKDVLENHLRTLQARQKELQQDIEKHETALAHRRGQLDVINETIYNFSQHPWLVADENQTSVLEEEMQTYDREKPRLLAESEGKHVLIKGGQVIGVYETHMEAVRDGYHALGNVPFLVKEIVENEPIYQMASHPVQIG